MTLTQPGPIVATTSGYVTVGRSNGRRGRLWRVKHGRNGLRVHPLPVVHARHLLRESTPVRRGRLAFAALDSETLTNFIGPYDAAWTVNLDGTDLRRLIPAGAVNGTIGVTVDGINASGNRIVGTITHDSGMSSTITEVYTATG